eukprot:5631198-Prorocentrum_lima.AAC.1
MRSGIQGSRTQVTQCDRQDARTNEGTWYLVFYMCDAQGNYGVGCRACHSVTGRRDVGARKYSTV